MRLTSSVLEAIQKRDRTFEVSSNARRIEEVAAAYTEDATVLSRNERVERRWSASRA